MSDRISAAFSSVKLRPYDNRSDMMDNERHRLIRDKAYEMWERDGRPEGQADRHWLEAEVQVRPGTGSPSGADSPSGAGSPAGAGTIGGPDAVSEPSGGRTPGSGKQKRSGAASAAAPPKGTGGPSARAAQAKPARKP